MTPTSRWCLGHFRLWGHLHKLLVVTSSAIGRSGFFLTLNNLQGSLCWHLSFYIENQINIWWWWWVWEFKWMDLPLVVNKQIQNVIHCHLLFRRCVFLIDRLKSPWGICNESLASRSCKDGQCRSKPIHENIYSGGAFVQEYKSEWKILLVIWSEEFLFCVL